MIDRSTIGFLLRHGKDALDLSVGDGLARLAEFVTLVEEHGFARACRRTLGGDECPGRFTDALEQVAGRITHGVPRLNGMSFSKAVQEAFLEACGVDLDLDLAEADGCVDKFVDREGSDGVMELCIHFYVFNRIWFTIQDDLRYYCEDEQVFAMSTSIVMRMSKAAVADAVSDSNGEVDHDFERGEPSLETETRLMARIRERVLRPV